MEKHLSTRNTTPIGRVIHKKGIPYIYTVRLPSPLAVTGIARIVTDHLYCIFAVSIMPHTTDNFTCP